MELGERFRTVVESARQGPLSGAPIVVAISGGLDSVVLLHLLRFAVHHRPLELHAAHFDHGARVDSAADADWVRGLAHAWKVPLSSGRAREPLRSEEAARDARYAFLESVRRSLGAEVVAIAHHADDQAETVLFRVVRGTGTRGLQGMAEFREPGIWRPLLGFWRDELSAYAEAAGLHWREDPTNQDWRFARNVLRASVLPELETSVAPGARRALVRLAELAREEEDAWLSLLPEMLASVGLEEQEGAISLDFARIARLHPAVRGRIIRELGERLGHRLDAAGTRYAAAFSSSGVSGRRVELGGALVLRRDLDRLVLVGESVPEADRHVRIADARRGSGRAFLGGRRLAVEWSPQQNFGPMPQRFAVTDPRFPLTVRARLPGDRIRLAGGTKKLKKVFLEARIPEPKRGRLPVLVDRAGSVLWVPGVAEAIARSDVPADHSVLHIGIADADNK